MVFADFLFIGENDIVWTYLIFCKHNNTLSYGCLPKIVNSNSYALVTSYIRNLVSID